MKAFTKLLCGVMLLCSSLFAQSSFTETNLAAAITSASETTISVASTSGITGSGGGNGYGLYVDREFMRVTAVVNAKTLQVIRGEGTRATTHANNALVFAGPPNWFQARDKSGSCTAANETVLPVINTQTGNSFDCIGSLWVEGTRIGVATLATNFRQLQSAVTLNTAGSITTGSVSAVGIRGLAQIASGTTVTAGYVYGAQGKLVVSGTLNGSEWVFGLVGQLDASAATALTAGSHLSPIWSDAGATSPAVTCAFCDGVVITNTTATTYHSLIYGYSKASYVFDFTGNGTPFALSTSGTSSGNCAQSGGVVFAKAMPVHIDGTDYWIPLCNAL